MTMNDLRTQHIDFNANNFETIMKRINDIKERLNEIRQTEIGLVSERTKLTKELTGTEELIERTKRQNPEHFMITHDDFGKECIDFDFVNRNNFIVASSGEVFGYVLDKNGKKVHIYNIKNKETVCKTKNHNYQIVDESPDQCSVCKRDFAKLK